MSEFKQFLNLEEEKINGKILLLFILVAYAFNIAVRYVYISYVGDTPQFQWQGHLMINNNDGYFWAEGARDILAGFHQNNDLSPITNPASILIAGIAKFLPFLNFDVILEYLPGFLGSLVVVPVILIGRALGSSWLGFLAGLMSGMVWSYYHRTMFGYLDTDMLIIVLPTFALWAILWSFQNNNKTFFFLAPLIEILMIKWHGGLFNVANGFFIMSTIYVALFHRDNKLSIFFLLFLMIPILKVAFVYKLLILLLASISFMKFDKSINLNYLFISIVGIYLLIVGLPWIMNTLNNGYFTRAVTNTDDGLKYFSVVNTVSEAGHISYDTLVHRISGGWLGFLIGGLGYILLSIRYPIFLISLPMVVLGLFAIRGGLRFTVFAVPFFALGNGYIAYLFGNSLKKIFIQDKMVVYSKYLFSLFIMGIFIYPNYKHIHRYIMPTVFNTNEIKVLDNLHHKASREDYVLSWWDYGYPIRYYSDVKTLVDGAKHSGNVNFPVSFALTRDLVSSRNIAILDVYQTEYNYNNHLKEDYLKGMMKRYNYKNPNDFLEYLSTDIKLPKLKENIYYYLPLRMFNILPTVAVFSSIDLKTGKKENHFFSQSNRFQKKGSLILLSNGIKIDLKKAEVILGKQIIPIKRFAITKYSKSGKLNRRVENIHQNGLNIVFMKSYNKWLILDDFYFNSAYIQLFVFENTQGLFEPVELTPYVKVYKVKQ